MNPNRPEAVREQLQLAEQAMTGQDFERARTLAHAVLEQDRLNPMAHLLRGVASLQLGDIDRAVTDLDWVRQREPGNVRAAFFLGQALRRDQQFARATEVLAPLTSRPELGQAARFELAISQDRMGDTNAAIETYLELLRTDPRHADAAANVAALLERVGRLDEAMAWVDRALTQAPKNTAAQLTRARVLRASGQAEEALMLLELLLDHRLSPLSQVIALNQMGRCLEALDRYEEAFDCFYDANEVQRVNDPEAEPDDYASYGVELALFLRQWLGDHPSAEWSPTPDDERDPPVFLLGFPMSGHSGVEAALAAHPHVAMVHEKELMLEVRRRWISMEHFDRLHRMSEDEVRQTRHLYRTARAGAFQDPDAQVVVDRLPLNSMWLALIHRLYPRAKILHWMRDPRDACLACYSQNFQLVGAMPYFLGLDTTARYYDAIQALVTDACDDMNLDRTELRYEQACEDPQAVLAQACEALGVDPSLAPDVATSIPREGAPGHWKHHAEALAPVLPTLEGWAARLGYAT